MDDVKKLIRQLKSSDPEVRLAAVLDLGQVDDEKAIPHLIESLYDIEKKVVVAAADLLGGIGNPIAVPALLDKLESTDLDIRGMVAQALGDMYVSEAEQALIGRINDENEILEIKAYAIRDLGINEPSWLPIVLEALESPDAYLRYVAEETLLTFVEFHDVDLSQVAKSLKIAISTLKAAGVEDIKKEKGWACQAYEKISKAMKERKQAEMPDLPARFKPPKKKGIYRTRRVANG